MRSTERRESGRVNYLCECQVELEGLSSGKMTGRINDLSPEGAFLDSMLCLPIGSTLKLKFKVQEKEIQASGVVRYFMRHVGMGIQFLDLTPEDRETIESVVIGKPMPAPPVSPEPVPARSLPPVIAPDPACASGPVMSGDLGIVNLFDIIDIVEKGPAHRLSNSAGRGFVL